MNDFIKIKVNNKIKKSEFIVYVYFAIITFCKGIGLNANDKFYTIIFVTATILVSIKVIRDEFCAKECFNMLSLLLIGVIDFLVGKTTTILFTAIALCTLKNIKIKKVLKIMLYARAIAFIIMIVLSISGVIENNVILHYRNNYGFTNRYCFGYSHPNLAHSSFAIIIFLWAYVYSEKANLGKILILEVLNYILYNYTFSRTGFIVISIFLIFIILFKKIKFLQNIIIKIAKNSLIIFIVLSIIFALGYSWFEIVKKMDILFTGRIRYMNVLITNYTIPIIGSNDYNNVVLFDNGYFSLLYEGGILATIWFVLFSRKSNNFLKKNNMYTEIIFVLFLLFYCMFESYYINIIMNPSLIFLAYSIFNENKQIQENSYLVERSEK